MTEVKGTGEVNLTVHASMIMFFSLRCAYLLWLLECEYDHNISWLALYAQLMVAFDGVDWRALHSDPLLLADLVDIFGFLMFVRRQCDVIIVEAGTL